MARTSRRWRPVRGLMPTLLPRFRGWALLGACSLFGTAMSLAVAIVDASTAAPWTDGITVWGFSTTSAGDDVVAAATKSQCTSSCSVLLGSSDEGAHWTRRSAAGWPAQAPVATTINGRTMLTVQDKNGVDVSSDKGQTFTSYPGPSGFVDVAHTPSNGSHALLVSTPSAGIVLEDLPPLGRASTFASVPGLSQLQLRFNPSYPRVALGQPIAYGVGRDQATGFPVMVSCFADLTCARGGVIVPIADAARLFISPRVDDDHLVLAATRNAFFRSSDGGRVFSAISPVPTRPNTLITTVTDVAFSPDFDAVHATGHIVAAVIAVTGSPNHSGSTYGGIYTSTDGAAWSKLGTVSALDAGAQAVTVSRSGHVMASYIALPANQGVTGGILCSADLQAWNAVCPSTAAPDEAGAVFSPPGDPTPATVTSSAATGSGSSVSSVTTEPPSPTRTAARTATGGIPARAAMGFAAACAATLLAAASLRVRAKGARRRRNRTQSDVGGGA
jgi:hypothetical protein